MVGRRRVRSSPCSAAADDTFFSARARLSTTDRSAAFRESRLLNTDAEPKTTARLVPPATIAGSASGNSQIGGVWITISARGKANVAGADKSADKSIKRGWVKPRP